MKRLLTVLVLVAWSTISGAAVANPMWISMSHGVQVPDSMHVQVTAMFDSSFGGEGDRPLYVMQGDRKLPFVTGQFTISENTGSGIASVNALQVCDCDLAPGSYLYHFVYPDGVETFDVVADVTVNVVTPPPAPEEPKPMPEGEDVMPWEIPSDPWPKGVDCVEWCKNPVEPLPDPDVADVVSDTVSLPDLAIQDGLEGVDHTGSETLGNLDQNTSTDHQPEGLDTKVSTYTDASNTAPMDTGTAKEESKGCSASALSATPIASALLFASLLALLAFARRRVR